MVNWPAMDWRLVKPEGRLGRSKAGGRERKGFGMLVVIHGRPTGRVPRPRGYVPIAPSELCIETRQSRGGLGGAELPATVINRLREGDGPILLPGHRKIGTVPDGFKPLENPGIYRVSRGRNRELWLRGTVFCPGFSLPRLTVSVKCLSENRLGERDSPIFLTGHRKIGTVPDGFRIRTDS